MMPRAALHPNLHVNPSGGGYAHECVGLRAHKPARTRISRVCVAVPLPLFLSRPLATSHPAPPNPRRLHLLNLRS